MDYIFAEDCYIVKNICSIKKLLSAALVFSVAASCSVKEPRCGGPCWILVDSGDRHPVSVSLWDGDEMVGSDAADYHRIIEFSTDRDVLIVTGISGEDTSIPKDGILLLEDGSETDSVFACHSVIDCIGECVRDTVRCRKQFATVRLIMDISSHYLKSLDSVRIVSCWHGLDLRSMSPVPGRYMCSFRCEEDVLPMRILRQGDETLCLEFIDSSGTVLHLVKLGLLLQKAGYDWGEENLQDIELVFTAAGGIELSFAVKDWETGEFKEIVI